MSSPLQMQRCGMAAPSAPAAARARPQSITSSRRPAPLTTAAAKSTSPTAATLQAVPISPETFAPFGQLIEPTHDGKEFDDQDAKLRLDAGTPRFYIMRLPRRGLAFDRITYHAKVTQCLGGLGTNDWFLAVAKPTFSVDAYPTLDDLVAFRIPPGVSIKLEAGTWHAGPLFDDDEHMDFFNLELSDTNVVDHNTHVYDAPLHVSC